MIKNIAIILAISLIASQSFAEESKVSTDNQAATEQAGQAPSKSENKTPKLMPLKVKEVSFSSAEYKQNLPGRVLAYKTAEVRARVSGIVRARKFTEGTKVQAGQLLFKIEDRSLKATLRARKADVATAVSAYKLAEQTLKRYKKLLKMGAVSRQEYDTYAAQTNQSESQIEQAKANLEIAQINLDYASVKAPIYGRINQALVTEGALATADSTKMATIEQIDKVYVDFSRSSSEAKALKKMMKDGNVSNSKDKEIKLLFDDGSEYKRKGKLEFSAMRVDEATGSISLRAIFENPKYELLPGMFVRVQIPVANVKNIIKVPQKAVEITNSGATVYLIKENKLVPVSVKLGDMAGSDWIVLDGLKEGDEVVISDITIAKTANLPVKAVKTKPSSNINNKSSENAKDASKEIIESSLSEEDKLKKVSAIESDINSVKNINKDIKARMEKNKVNKVSKEVK